MLSEPSIGLFQAEHDDIQPILSIQVFLFLVEEVHKQVKTALAEFDEGGDLFSEIEINDNGRFSYAGGYCTEEYNAAA